MLANSLIAWSEVWKTKATLRFRPRVQTAHSLSMPFVPKEEGQRKRALANRGLVRAGSGLRGRRLRLGR